MPEKLTIKARTQYRIVGGDFSAQEPRLTAFYSGDENMINAYKEGKDLYAVIASMSFDKPYEDCLEFYPEGTKIIFEGKEVICGYKTHQNKEGKGRRTQAKRILLGLLYGRGAAAIGEQINKTKDEAQEIINKFFKAFPKVQKWINDSIDGCRKNGYVEDIVGRKRRLPDIKLPRYTIKYTDATANKGDFNPFLGCNNRTSGDKKIEMYNNLLEKSKYKKQIDDIKLKALKDGITIINNGGFISQAERQCVNARVQGGAATLTKCALIKIYEDSRLRAIKAKLINTVHDEILLEVPEEFSEKAEAYLVDDMVSSAKDLVPTVPMACDTYNVPAWYFDEYCVLIENEFKHLQESGLSKEEAFKKECENRTEMTEDTLKQILEGYLK